MLGCSVRQSEVSCVVAFEGETHMIEAVNMEKLWKLQYIRTLGTAYYNAVNYLQYLEIYDRNGKNWKNYGTFFNM